MLSTPLSHDSRLAFRILLAGAITLTPLASARAQQPSDFLTRHTIAAVTARPNELAQSSLVKHYPIEVAEAVTQDFFGTPLAVIDRITVIVEPPMGATPLYGVVVSASEPMSFDRFRPEVTQHATLDVLDGRPLQRSNDRSQPSLLLMDDKTLAIGPVSVLKRIGSGAPHRIESNLLAAEAVEADLFATIDLEPLRPLLGLALMEARNEAPPEAERFFDAVDLIASVVLTANLSGDRTSSLRVQANDPSAAETLARLLDDGVEELRTKIFEDENYQELANNEEAVARAMASYLARSFDEKVAMFRPTRQGETEFVLGKLDAGNEQQTLGTVAVVGILVALLLPAVQAAREAARRVESSNHMKQLALAVLNYESAEGRLPPQAICAADGTPLLSWRVAILPYLEQQGLYNQFRLNEPWDSPHNLALLPMMPDLFVDPSHELEPADGKTHYLGVAGPRAYFSGEQVGRKLSQITDGLTRTLMILQTDDTNAVEWTKPVDYDAAANAANPYAKIGSRHPGVFLGAYGDASVSSIPLDTDPGVLRLLMTIDDGQFVDRP